MFTFLTESYFERADAFGKHKEMFSHFQLSVASIRLQFPGMNLKSRREVRGSLR